MKTEFIYLRYCAAAILTIFLWFWAAAPLFNFSPILGALAVIIAPLLDYWLIKPIYKNKSAQEKSAQNYKIKK
ncbi:MAG: hypothetical protein WC554_09190 [Clostridia bacterium]